MSNQASVAIAGDGKSICENCRQIDFQDLLQNPRQVRFTHLDEGGPSPYTIVYSNSCKLCRFMFREVPSKWMNEAFEMRSYLFSKMSSWAREISPNPKDNCVLLKVGFQHSGGFFNWPDDDRVLCKPAKDASEGPYCAQPVQKIWDCVKARLWLDTCARFHGSLCKEEVPQIPGMNMIDCERLVIVKVTKDMPWLALSYVWGKSFQAEDAAGYRAGSSISSAVFKTISDAITVTLQLGYRYLWVDEYCIDQTDEQHRDEQIKRMDQIYRGADLTIVAAAGDNKAHGLPGVGSTEREVREVVCVNEMVIFSNGPSPDDQAERSKWYTRAWTFQEGFLSKRVLLFTECQTSFYCQGSSWMEGLGNPHPDPTRKLDEDLYHVRFYWNLRYLTSPHWNWNHVAAALESYTQRQITKEADTLDACSGVMNYIRRSRPTTKFLRGLPFFFTSAYPNHITVIDSFEHLVTAALSWHCRKDVSCSPQRKFTFPSWTWAGWSGRADFWLRDVWEPKHQPFSRHTQLESSSGHVVATSALYKENYEYELDTVALIQFEAPTISASNLSIQQDQGDDSDSDDSDSEESYNLTVSGRRTYRLWHANSCTSIQLIENVQMGIWSCFVLCAGRCSKATEDPIYSRFVLVVRWNADGTTAERVDSFNIFSYPSKDAKLEPFGEDWIRRRVRLI